MDFFGIIYDMKNGKKVPYSKTYFDTLFAAKLGGSDVKTLTGALPLTFSTSEDKLRDWTICGNNTQHNYSAEGTLPLTITTHTAGAASDWVIEGNDDNGTENLLRITAESQTVNNVQITINADKTVTVNGTASGNIYFNLCAISFSPGTYTLSSGGIGTTSGGTAVIYAYDGSYHICDPNDKTWTLSETKNISFVVWISSGKTVDNLTFKPMFVQGSTAPDHYIPYQQGVGEKRVDGYYVPLTVSHTGQTDKNYEIFIGDSPLTEGETISKSSTGVDIELFEGENTVSTTLYNKPETSITYTDYLGVGEYVNGQWQIPLTVTCDRNLLNIYGNMAHSGGVHTIDFNVETSSVTGEMPADSFYQLGFQNAIVKGDETFVISFDKTTAGTAELRMTKGTGSSAEVIETFDISAIKSYQVVFECEESFWNVYPRLVATEAATQTFEHLMIKKASDKGGFVPYGAKYEYNVPIDAPLTDGQSVTDTLTINTFEGKNVLDTTLDNKPQMSITYKGG